MPTVRRDMDFLLHEVFDFAEHYAGLSLSDELAGSLDKAFINAVVDEAQRFTSNELAPLNATGDIQGCQYHEGEVTTPEGFKAAYQKYQAAGWSSLTGDPTHGGQGLPDSMGLFLEELSSTANLAWSMYPGLSRGAMEALEAHGSPEQKQAFLEPMIAGRWTGTMCLTEPHAGSDVGLARTKAELNADGTYAISGTKIFISAGEHDMAENIVHLVLARAPDAPAGTKGISMFLVPKIRLDGSRNKVKCGSIEEKMGIHGNATCVLHFDEATGHLVGEVNKGMSYMFTMMNAARVAVGLQGVCLGQAGINHAAQYARERLQMRSLTGPKAPDKPADPIIVHPDVRRMLLTQKAFVEGGRALVYHCGQLIDRQRLAQDPADRTLAESQLDFLTPIVKGFLTELGYESVNAAVQIHGGHGFIRETGVEQLVRDARITLLYEGTTGIQALDLLGRKILQKQGKGLIEFVAIARAEAQVCEAAGLADVAQPLTQRLDEWQQLSFDLGGKAMENLDEVGAAAVDFLFYSGYVVFAYLWARQARVAQAQLAQAETSEPEYYEGKLAIARFYMARMLPRADAHKLAIQAGGETLFNISDEALAG